MEFTLDINMNTEAFASFKDEVLKAAKAKGACDEGIEAHLNSATPQEWLDKCGYYLGWFPKNGIDITLEGFTHCDGGLDLCGYKYHLPEGFTYCKGDLDLDGYQLPLPSSFTHCGRYLFKNKYNHPLPKMFRSNVYYLNTK